MPIILYIYKFENLSQKICIIFLLFLFLFLIFFFFVFS